MPLRPDPFWTWCEQLACYDAEWTLIYEALPRPDQYGPDLGDVAAAWLSWPGREQWLREHPQVWP